MSELIAPEVTDCVRRIVKETIGTQTEVLSVGQSWGGIYNKLFVIETSERNFNMKAERKKIFPSTRTGQIENEVEGSRLFKQAKIRSTNIAAYDLTRDNEMGVPYIVYEPIDGDNMWELLNYPMDETIKSEAIRQVRDIYARMSAITNTHFGSLSPTGLVGWHETWADYYGAAFNMLIQDCIGINLFTEEELAIVKTAVSYIPVNSENYRPAFQHGDFASQNFIWGHVCGEPKALYVIDFGNALWGIPHYDEYKMRQDSGFGGFTNDVTTLRNIDERLYDNLLAEFQKMLWKESEKLAEDYAGCYPWFITSIEVAKQDTSRDHVLKFVAKCREAVI